MLKAFLAGAVVLLYATTSFASGTVSVNGHSYSMTESAAAEIAVLAAKAEKEANPPKNVVDRYLDVGKGLGLAIGAAAKEVGMTPTEFVNSPVGESVAWMIRYRFVGKDWLNIGLAIAWFAVTWAAWGYIFYYIAMVRRTYNNGHIEYRYYDTDEAIGTRIVMLAILIVDIIVGICIGA